nr:unnamed protein product [Callosobruchus chinensis]
MQSREEQFDSPVTRP